MAEAEFDGAADARSADGAEARCGEGAEARRGEGARTQTGACDHAFGEVMSSRRLRLGSKGGSSGLAIGSRAC
jgi:hypothetical protein